jgi:hypothetical protein
MPTWICKGCGVQQAPSGLPPAQCPICVDEREAVRPGGQAWTTPAELGADHTTEIRDEEPDLLGIGVDPSFAIGQRALLVSTPHGNVLWDCVPLLDENGRAEITRRGGVSVVCASHPHFYGAMVDYADAFDARILLPQADRHWIQRPSDRIETFVDTAEPLPGLHLVRTGGHFEGATVLHWAAGAGGAGALLTGDTIAVVEDRRWVSFMYSFPNLIPLDADTVELIAQRVAGLRFERVYGGWWGHVVLRDGAQAVRRSADRYIRHVREQA